MLSWPRLGANRNRPDDVIWIWEQVFRSLNPSGGRVVTVWNSARVPFEVSRLYALTLHPCSLEK